MLCDKHDRSIPMHFPFLSCFGFRLFNPEKFVVVEGIAFISCQRKVRMGDLDSLQFLAAGALLLDGLSLTLRNNVDTLVTTRSERERTA